MRRPILAAVLLAALALTGCTTQGATSSKKFSGAAKEVSDAVGEIQTAGRRKDSAKLCGELFARSLVDQLGGSSCSKEVDDAISDADDFTIEVRDVKVSGDQATATVRQDGKDKEIQFVREGNRWKARGFSTG
jgi:hypothetical protein